LQLAEESQMGVTLEQGEKSSVIRLEGAVDIASAAELKKLLLQALSSGERVHVALEGVTDLDVTVVQLLWAARSTARAADVEFAFAGQTSESVTFALLHAGLEDFVASVKADQASGVELCQR
jgi:anti-anti-sigma factor